MSYKSKNKPKAPKKLFRTKLNRIFGIVSPSLFYHYLRIGDKDVIEYARKTGFFGEPMKYEGDGEQGG